MEDTKPVGAMEIKSEKWLSVILRDIYIATYEMRESIKRYKNIKDDYIDGVPKHIARDLLKRARRLYFLQYDFINGLKKEDIHIQDIDTESQVSPAQVESMFESEVQIDIDLIKEEIKEKATEISNSEELDDSHKFSMINGLKATYKKYNIEEDWWKEDIWVLRPKGYSLRKSKGESGNSGENDILLEGDNK